MFASTASVDASAPLLGTGAPRDGRTASRATDRSGEAHRAPPEDAEDASSFGRSAPRGPTPGATARSAARALLVGAASFALVALVVASVALAAAGGASAAPRASRGEGVTPIPSLREGEATPARGHVVVGFQSRGFYNYKATIRLLKQAFPEHDLVLVGQAVDAAALVDNDRVRRGHPGWPGDPGFPAYVDLVVEGPNVHRHIDGPRACGFQVGSNTGAWIQSIAEPAHIYDDTLWCPHAAPPAVRIDTSLAKFKERAYGERATSYLWAPYSQMHLVGNAALSDRKFSGDDDGAAAGEDGDAVAALGAERRRVDGGGADYGDVFRRPFLAAYMSSDCRGHRESFFSHLRRRASLARNKRAGVSEVHALGACSHTHASPAMSEYSPFREYRFVETFENAEEVGYVTEKLGSAMSSGAVPVYWGDPQAAAMVFDSRAFIDAKGFWRDNGMVAAANSVAAATDGDWASLAQHVIDVDKDEALFRSFLLPDVRARHDEDERGADSRSEATRVPGLGKGGYPFPFPDARMEPAEELERRPRVKQAATRLANAVAVGRRRRRAPPERRRTRNNWRADAPGADEDAFEEERPLALPFEPEALEAERR